MKKKTVAIVAAVALVAMALPALAFASAAPNAWQGSGMGACIQPVLASQAASADRIAAACPAYVDDDQDGVCDNRATGRQGYSGFVDADGDGVCDNCAAESARCPAYVDVDGDGVCDRAGTGQGQGQGYGCGRGAGNGGHGYGRMRG